MPNWSSAWISDELVASAVEDSELVEAVVESELVVTVVEAEVVRLLAELLWVWPVAVSSASVSC